MRPTSAESRRAPASLVSRRDTARGGMKIRHARGKTRARSSLCSASKPSRARSFLAPLRAGFPAPLHCGRPATSRLAFAQTAVAKNRSREKMRTFRASELVKFPRHSSGKTAVIGAYFPAMKPTRHFDWRKLRPLSSAYPRPITFLRTNRTRHHRRPRVAEWKLGDLANSPCKADSCAKARCIRRHSFVAAPHATRPRAVAETSRQPRGDLGMTVVGRRRQRVATTHLRAAPLLPSPPRASHAQDSAPAVHESPFKDEKNRSVKNSLSHPRVRFFKANGNGIPKWHLHPELHRHLFRERNQSKPSFSEIDFRNGAKHARRETRGEFSCAHGAENNPVSPDVE